MARADDKFRHIILGIVALVTVIASFLLIQDLKHVSIATGSSKPGMATNMMGRAATPSAILPAELLCDDEDGGQNYAVTGAISLGEETFMDSCVDSIKLKEYYCSNNRIAYLNYSCTIEGKTCRDNACI
jgi:hypothetical protein